MHGIQLLRPGSPHIGLHRIVVIFMPDSAAFCITVTVREVFLLKKGLLMFFTHTSNRTAYFLFLSKLGGLVSLTCMSEIIRIFDYK